MEYLLAQPAGERLIGYVQQEGMEETSAFGKRNRCFCLTSKPFVIPTVFLFATLLDSSANHNQMGLTLEKVI